MYDFASVELGKAKYLVWQRINMQPCHKLHSDFQTCLKLDCMLAVEMPQLHHVHHKVVFPINIHKLSCSLSRKDYNAERNINMLKPFAMTDVKVKAKTRKGQQRSLWAVRSIPDRKAPAPMLKDIPESFASIAPMWERKGGGIVMEDVGALKGLAGRLATAIEARLSAHYREMKKAALQHPSDVAAYLVLREVDEKACMEVPRLRLRALDFGIKALLEK